MDQSIVVIGAGIAGLMAARVLQEAGACVVILEKSRGLGGRLATKRVGEAVFDQGAQYFTARDPVFRAYVERWQAAGVVAPWPGVDGEERFIGRPSMTALGKVLAEGLEVRREQKVTALSRCEDHWCLDLENHGHLRAERVLLTAPVPQSLALLGAGLFTVSPEQTMRLGALQYDPCLALMVTVAGRSRLPSTGVRSDKGAISWAADNSTKGVSPNTCAVTLHLSPEFSNVNYGRPEAEIIDLVRAEAEELIGATITGATLHRWKFSRARVTYPELYVWWPKVSLGFCGDAFGGPRVEGAALSGLALAARVLAELRLTPHGGR
jgi:renalase